MSSHGVTVEHIIQIVGGGCSERDPWVVKQSSTGDGDGIVFPTLQKKVRGCQNFVLGVLYKDNQSLRDYMWLDELRKLRNEQQNPSSACKCVFGESSVRKRRRVPRQEDAGAKSDDRVILIDLPKSHLP